MIRWLEKVLISKKKVWIFTAIFLLFVAIILPFVASFTTEQIGVSESPDTLFSFDINTYYELMNAYGEEGRNFYILIRWTFDVVWPLTYFTFLFSSIGYLLKKMYMKRYYLLMLPVISVSLDFFENIVVTIAMTIYPVEVDALIVLLMGASLFKWVFITITFIVLTGLLIRNMYRTIKIKMKN